MRPRHSRARRIVVAALAAALTPALPLSGGGALAHGPAPAILGVAADDGTTPSVLLLSEGLALRLGPAWHYLCPASWGGPEGTLALSADSRTTFVIGESDLFALQESAQPTPLDFPHPTWMIRRLEAAADNVYALITRADGSEVWVLTGDHPARQLRTDATRHVTLSADGNVLHLAHLADDRLHLDTVDGETGQLLDRAAIELGDVAGLTPSLRVAGGELFVVLAGSGDHRLGSLEGDGFTEHLRVSTPIHGPVAVGATRVVVTDGDLLHLDAAGQPHLVDDTRRYTCLSGFASSAYACALRDLYRLEPQGAVEVAPVVRIDDLAPPPFEELDPARREACRAEWTHFALDARLDPTGHPPDDGDPDAASGGCATAGGSSPAAPWPVALALFGALAALAPGREGRAIVPPPAGQRRGANDSSRRSSSSRPSRVTTSRAGNQPSARE